jgi:ribosomal subunit interface protein
MQTPLKITFRNLPASEALEQHIRDKAAKLDSVYPTIIACNVTVELPHKHHTHGKLVVVRIDLRVPGNEIAVNQQQDEDVYVALRDAFDVALRRLEQHAHMQRGEVKRHARQND